MKYPYDEVRDKFYLRDMGAHFYVTNTITWMMLKAILDGYTDIQLYGVHMAHDEEYAWQLPNVAWAAGIIQGLSLEDPRYRISVAGDSALLKARFEYGYEEPSDLAAAIDLRGKQLEKGVAQEKGRALSASWRTMMGAGLPAACW